MSTIKTMIDLAEDSEAENVTVTIELANGLAITGIMPIKEARKLNPDLQTGAMLPEVRIDRIQVIPELPPEPAIDPERK